MASNANVRRAGSSDTKTNRVLVYAPDASVKKWIESELAKATVEVRYVTKVADIVSGLVDTEPPRPQILIADFDAMNAGDVLHLHGIRERGWFGSVIGLGKIDRSLKASLNIERILTRPFANGVLGNAVARVGLDQPTTKLPKF